MSALNLKLDRRRVDSLTSYEHGAKVHTPEQVDAIVASIQRFGFNDPIGITPDGVVIEGEGRLLAARRLGLEEVPVIILEGWTERDAGLYRIAHNKIALTTGFNVEALVAALRDIVSADISFEAMGFDHAAQVRLGLVDEEPTLTSVTSDIEANNLDYIIMWDNADQKRQFEAFVATQRRDGESPTDALLRVMTETMQSAPVEEQSRENLHQL